MFSNNSLFFATHITSPEIDILSLFNLLGWVPCSDLDGKISISSSSTLMSTDGALNKLNLFIGSFYFSGEFFKFLLEENNLPISSKSLRKII